MSETNVVSRDAHQSWPSSWMVIRSASASVARRSDVAAEAGVDTGFAYRGRGYAGQVTSAWALAMLASGRIPLHSTNCGNTASLAVATKLELVAANFQVDLTSDECEPRTELQQEALDMRDQ